MTNLIAALTISLSTNWTGTIINDREAGIVITNYDAKVVYENKTNYIRLKTATSDKVAWRREAIFTNAGSGLWMYKTNIIIPHNGRIWMTNN